MVNIAQPLPNEMKVINISSSEKTPYFYMLIDYGTCYLCLRSNRHNYSLEIVRQISKDEISLEEAQPLLLEGKKFFKHTEIANQKLFEKYGID